MVRRAIVVVLAMPAMQACGGNTETPEALDACAPSFDAAIERIDDAASEDAAPWWLDVYDAATYQGFSAPIPGEYPPNGPGVCLYSGCFPGGSCDPETGWCCGGKAKQGACVCGADAGCVPPQVCCAVPGELSMRCVATPDLCPGIR